MRRSDELLHFRVRLFAPLVIAMVGGAVGLVAALSSCAVVNGSAYRVRPCPARSDTTATADSLRRHIGCFDTRDSTRKER